MNSIVERRNYAGLSAKAVADLMETRVTLKRSRRKRRRSVIAGGALLLSTVAVGAKPAMEFLGLRCKPVGTHHVVDGETLGGIMEKRFPTYNRLQRFSAEACTAVANGIDDPRKLPADSSIEVNGLE